MDDLEDELDLRHHRGRKPDVYYRCPALETLDGALRNELEKNAALLIPIEIVTEFVFSLSSTITVPATHQHDLDALFEPADYPQSIPVQYALCHGIQGKERLKLQRAIARCLIEAIQYTDGFKYSERQALNKDGSDGVRFKYVCSDSLQGRSRKSNKKAESAEDGGVKAPNIPSYDCGGAIHINFSQKREAINVVYIHNPIHRDVACRPDEQASNSSALTGNANGNVAPHSATNGSSSATKQRSKKVPKAGNNASHDTNLDDDSAKAPPKKKRKKDAASPGTGGEPATKSKNKQKQPQSPTMPRQKATKASISEPMYPVKGKCLRCREKGTKCNEAKPSCNQCLRGLWTCQYDLPGLKKRSKDGCLNCKARKRKCTEEKPSCAYCLKIDDDCTYGKIA